MNNDLASFALGITYATFTKSKDLGVHYQIINHKLYRQRECMFPSRLDKARYFIIIV